MKTTGMDYAGKTKKLYDLATIYTITGNNAQFFEKLLLVFIENIANDLKTLNNAALSGKWDEVGQVAHKMKPSLAHFQINSVKETILELEHRSSNDKPQLDILIGKINTDLSAVIAGLKEEFPLILK